MCCSGTGPPQACLNAMLHSNCRGSNCLFYRVVGKAGMYGLMVSDSILLIGGPGFLLLWLYGVLLLVE